jgi:DNA-binding response OmpR family regulator
MKVRKSILVVDDNERLVGLIERLLESAGYQVFTAFDGLTALDKAREECPDLIILDIVMPGEINGYQACYHLHTDRRTKDIPVLILTGKWENAEQSKRELNRRIAEQVGAYDLGAMDYMTKPVRGRELLSRIRGLLWFSGGDR